MAKFNIGDIICKDETSVPYTVAEIDEVSGPRPKYKLKYGNFSFFSFWDYCIGWKKRVTSDEVLRYGEVLTDDMVFGKPKGKSVLDIDRIRIRTILYESRIFYQKMVNGEVVEFKELTV